ncbi:MAG: acyl-CoA--6-aminopenicillanic acid acyltransferase [Rhodospirillaceae bacterium]|nr:acyl-CoA--6-aminopenicillanic acid acyltransferase [Rhodospirillaceae bacterium]|tara:strand:+ start:291 stop:1412 length:1122 start_codon:yes stop_codon:yes gene_type:complete
MTEPFPFIDVQGGPAQRGRQYGQQARERIERSVALYSGRLDALGLSRADLERLVAEIAPVCSHFGDAIVEEMHGIADGAGVSFEDIVLINARTEIVARARLETAPDGQPDGCTGVIVLPHRSASGRLIHAQNWDWLTACSETAIVMRVTPGNGPRYLTFTEAGGVARSGLNEAGIAITANYLECDRDYSQPGIPLPFIRRAVLEEQHLAYALKAVATTPKACSNNMMVSCSTAGRTDGFGIDFECAPDEAWQLMPDDGLLVHANHWIGPVARTKIIETGFADSPDSLYRDWRVAEHLGAHRAITPDDVKTALFDGFAAPYAVCRPPRDNDAYSTVAMIVMDPGQGIIEIAPLPAINRTFTRYALEGEPEMVSN